MASVTSLGLHQPTALEYAIQEQLLPENPPPSSYEWEVSLDLTVDGNAEDELLITKDTVIWSRGCIFRKCFGFKLEKEPITQALLTYFPVSEHNARPRANAKASGPSQTLSRALVVFLKTQAHIHFLDGGSHVVHMPFEVESACAAPQGVIIQRKYRYDTSVSASLKFPRVPPNSFLSNHLTAPPAQASQQSTFNIEGLGKPKALPLRLSSQPDSLWDLPDDKSGSHWPRLVILTDPLLDIGLVVTQPDRSAKGKTRKKSDKSPHFLDRAEEILHVEEISQLGGPTENRDDKIILAVTTNRETSMYTVWRLSYLPIRDPFLASRKPKRRRSGPRRSSIQPGLPSGATTPLQSNFKESFGAPLPGKRSRKSGKVEKADRALEKLESSLGIDQKSGVTRRTSRRVSSMLARADLSASQDRAGFAEQPQLQNHASVRRDTSYASQRNRASGTFTGPTTTTGYARGTHPLGDFPEGPVDTLLEELRVGGDFEGFHSMGLDDHDFDGVAQEMIFTKIHTIPIDNSNVRYSLSKQPARKQSKVFCVTGPQVVVDNIVRQQVLVGLQDPMERRLQLLTLHLQFENRRPPDIAESKRVVLTFGQLKKAYNVIDSCRIIDGNISMILMLSQANDGQRQLSVQAPWSPFAPIMLPDKLLLANMRTLAYRGSLVNREVGIRRAIAPVKGEMAGMRHPKLRGVVDILYRDSTQLHQIRIQLEPVTPQVRKILELLRAILPPPFTDHILAGWWDIIAWLRQQDAEVPDVEWSAIVIQVFIMYLALGVHIETDIPPPRRRSRSFLRSSSGARIDLADWEAMCSDETPGSLTHPSWTDTNPWRWMMEEDDSSHSLFKSCPNPEEPNFLTLHAKRALEYLSLDRSDGDGGPHEYLPTATSMDEHTRFSYAHEIFMGLHLLLEEQKLNIMIPATKSQGPVDLRAVLLQVAKWMRWSEWMQQYELEMPSDWLDSSINTEAATPSTLPPAPAYWSVLDWITKRLSQDAKSQAATLPTVAAALIPPHLPRIKMFDDLFHKVKWNRHSPACFVESIHQSGITKVVLESLPEAVLVPLQDAIAQCRPNPPSGWSTGLLKLVDRADADSILLPTNHPPNSSANLLAPNHNASWDFNSLCQNVMEFNDTPADDVAESDKHAVIRTIFKEDRRLDEAKLLLNTTKPRSIRLDPQPDWSEPFYLEKQKALVTRLATNTLSIPAGRGLLNYGLRFPLLTQKFHVHGFVLNCMVKPQNVTVGVDKLPFTEEKIAWAFFHSGVAAGLSISRDAKGIDTSWILYNKPGNDLSNRHAGFLLALGLNGHLKDVAKWVAFKYLTPKHTMTSIGLLLGLAASYIGTMDSLITRLLSVHVTRMLPRGAAELNLSPLTQTTGIMGIGLLYCNSQHRRMSEIMMSEIEHVETEDDEEPLRTECYRLAAGFALGFINLGKGTDLKGLNDMRITEKLLTLASATKKVEQVHILDRCSAAAVVAIALIYMKSEDHIVARKIDVPDATLQFDYIRPDILLLRTVAKHLILWSEIEPSHDWIRRNLPRRYHSRVQSPSTQSFDNSPRGPLNSTHLPFLTILAGLCFSLSLRYAGSSNLVARDLLLTYLHRFYEQCKDPNPDASFDERSVQVTARMCLDVVALSCATVMAGTCDLKVLRILRSLHGRNDAQTTYGSHMAAHMAVGILALGCGTQTFNTSNLAIASLLVAFYPVFPDSIQDNKSHLQAFRHFWVLATDPRCLVTKDVTTNTPVSVPISIQLKSAPRSANEEIRTTPCLLPPLTEVSSIRTTSPEFWNIELDFNAHPEYVEAFSHTQALYLRRRPVTDSPFAATMMALGRDEEASSGDSNDNATQPLDWLFDRVPTLQRLTHAERGLVLDRSVGGPDVGDAAGSVVDTRLVLEESISNPNREGMLGLKAMFEWVDWRAERAQEQQGRGGRASDSSSPIRWSGDSWLRGNVIESLKGGVWLASKE